MVEDEDRSLHEIESNPMESRLSWVARVVVAGRRRRLVGGWSEARFREQSNGWFGTGSGWGAGRGSSERVTSTSSSD